MTTETGKNLAKQAVLISSLLLVCVILFVNVTSPAFNIVILGAQLVPLALTLPGLFKGSARSMQWLCFVVLFFLLQGILLAFTPGRLVLGLLETASCLIMFFSAIIFIRAARTPV